MECVFVENKNRVEFMDNWKFIIERFVFVI